MIRIIVVAVLSMAAGAAVSYLYTPGPAPRSVVFESGDAPEPGMSPVPSAESLESLLAHESAVSGRAAIYQVAARADETDLKNMLEDASWLPDSEFKQLLLGALSLRATELDAGSGLEMVRTLELDSRQATELGLMLLEALGPSAESIEEVIAALPQIDKRRFRMGALERWAEEHPQRAFQEVLAVGDWQLRSDAVRRVAAVWVERDPQGAMVEADLLGDDTVGRAFRSAIVSRMAEIDPYAMVSYVNGSPQHENRLTRAVVDQLELMEPLEALGWAEQLVGRLGESARRSALQSWGREDPLAAFAYAESMPIGDERQQLLRAVATGYGRQDPDGALVWVESLLQAPADLSASVIAGIAQVDPERALDLAFQDNPPTSGGFGYSRGRYTMLNAVIGNAMSSTDIAIPDLVGRVLSLTDRGERSNALRLLADRWMRSDPRSAFEWVITEGNLPDQSLNELIGSLARHDPIMAASYTGRVAPAIRDVWIANVAQDYARIDPQAAISWLGQYRDEPAYSAGVAAIVHRAVEFDPSLAAGLLATLDDSGRNTQSAAESVARGWSRRNQQAARLWVGGLAGGPVRDAALRGFISGAFQESIPDASLLALFSSEESRQKSLTQVIYNIGQNDRAEARRLLDEHISLPEVRSQMEDWLDRQEGGGVVVYRGGIIISN